MGDVMRMIEKASSNTTGCNFLARNAIEMTRPHPPLEEFTFATPWKEILHPNDLVFVHVPPAGSANNAIHIEDSDEEQAAPVESATKRIRSPNNTGSNSESRKRSKGGSLLKSQGLENDSPIKLFATAQDISARQTDPTQSHLCHVMTLREMLGLDLSPQGGNTIPTKMEWIVVSDYLIDFGYLLHELPELVSIPNKLFFFGSGDPGPWSQIDEKGEFRRLNPSDDPSKPGKSTANPLKYKFFNGTHHTKLFLIGFEDRMRVIVHTANLLEEDLTLQANGAFIQDFFSKPKRTVHETGSTTISGFEQTLLSYMGTYGYGETRRWSTVRDEPEMTLLQQLALFDFSTAKAVLIPSSPGYYKLFENCNGQGYLKVKQSIEKYVDFNPQSKSSSCGHLVCQFSSMGSISEKWLRAFAGSLSVPTTEKYQPTGGLVNVVKLVWPTEREIQSSIQGVRGGGSVPGRLKNLHKPFLKPLYCKWSCKTPNPIFKGPNIPHIKTFYQLNTDTSLAWFMMGSHNLSKAAWGEVIKGKYGECFRVSSWELGVFISPKTIGKESQTAQLIPVGSNAMPSRGATIQIPLPYNCIPERYQFGDTPWHLDSLQQNHRDGFCH